jgi:hypothetical protein
MFEHRRQPLLPSRIFYLRVARGLAMASVLIIFSLGLGMAGYHLLERLDWVDSFANAAMILSGMGPLAPLQTTAGKIFAGCYALFSGLAFLSSVGIFFAPIFHRFLHKFHLESKKDASAS